MTRKSNPMKAASALILALLLHSSVIAAEDEPAVADPITEPADEDSITVTALGTLRTGVVAIGGKTTGTTITAKGITWELDFGKSGELRAAAATLDGKKVIVQGSLERRAGVQIKHRWIVTVTGLQAVGDAGVGGTEKPKFQATVGRTDTRIRFTTEGGATIFDVTSGFGIDKATIKRESDEWPKTILVRLHLGGLESFKAESGDVAVEWSVSSNGSARVSLWKGKGELAIPTNSPYRTEVRIVGANGKIPLKEGYFEVLLPAKLFEENPKEITLEWIDFYRN